MSRPKVTLKLATSLDGRIATASGESRWITGEAAREQVHRLRAEHQAVMIGVDTAIADDPELTVRLPGWTGRQPARVVLDSRQRIPSVLHLIQDARTIETVIVSVREPQRRLVEAGVTVLTVSALDERPEPAAVLAALGAHLAGRGGQGPSRVLVEGGGQVAASFLAAGLVDAVEWFRAPIVLGDRGRPAVGEVPLERLADAPRFRRVAFEPLGDDLWERYEVSA